MFYFRLAMVIFLIATICSITGMPAQDLTPRDAFEPQEVYPLPGALSAQPLFNSNNPEVVQTEGILLSTLSPANQANPAAHLDFAFTGPFGIFSHHIARPADEKDLRTLYQAFLLHNPGEGAAKVTVTAGATYRSQPDAPFKQLPPMVPNQRGKVYAGPGSRIADDMLRGKRPNQKLVKREVEIKPGETVVLAKLPIPVGKWVPPLNGRSTLLHLTTEEGKVQVADVAAFATASSGGKEVVPTDAYFIKLLNKGELAGPREKPASSPDAKSGFAYGRVAGVSQGTHWLQDESAAAQCFMVPTVGKAMSFVVSGLDRGTFGTGQIQSAPLLVRYPESAYRAHGNYGLFYDVVLQLKNSQAETRCVEVLFQTPLKTDKLEHGLTFAEPPYKPVFFRGTVRATYPDLKGKLRSKHFHLVQHRGERGASLSTGDSNLASVSIPAGERRQVRLQFVYPPDATPPQVITIRTVR